MALDAFGELPRRTIGFEQMPAQTVDEADEVQATRRSRLARASDWLTGLVEYAVRIQQTT